MRREVPPEARIASHVPHRVDLDYEGDEGHQAQHCYGEAVDHHTPFDACLAKAKPGDAKGVGAGSQEVPQDVPEEEKPKKDGGYRDEGALLREKSAEHDH